MDNFSCPAAEKADSEWRGGSPVVHRGLICLCPEPACFPLSGVLLTVLWDWTQECQSMESPFRASPSLVVPMGLGLSSA